MSKSSSQSLQDYLKKLEEILEDKPDKWYDNPRGYLLKPDFKRKEQERHIVQSKTSIFSLKSFIGLQYKKRFFVLNYDKKLLIYYNDNTCINELGCIDMTTVIDIDFSKVCDAPTLALDLITEDRYYTVVADSHHTMIKWAYAFNLVRRKQAKRVVQQRQSILQSADRWFKYDYTFNDEGPLMINVIGTSNVDKLGKVISNKIVVTSFEYNEDGSASKAEISGKIRINDFVTGINDEDFSCLTFDEAMNKIIEAPFPKTVHFLRDLSASIQSKRAADWAVVFYPTLEKKKRRYVEIHDDCIILFKPAPGGAASSIKDVSVKLIYLISIRPIIDHTMPAEEQHILSLSFKENACIDIFDDTNEITKQQSIETMTLTLSNERLFKTWRSILATPSVVEGETQPAISVLALNTIQDSGSTITLGGDSDLSVKSTITGKFSRRNLGLAGGILTWSRPKKSLTSRAPIKESKILIANSSSCNVKSVIAFEDIFEKNLSGNIYQLEIQTANGVSLIIGAKDQNTIMEWLHAITELVNVAPEETRTDVKLSTGIEKDYQAGKTNQHDDEDIDSNNVNGNNNGSIAGFLFVKRDALPGLSSLHRQKKFKKCFCVLDGFVLKTFESANHIQAGLEIDMRSVVEVRENPLPTAPENSIELLLESKNYLFVAEDDDEQMKWIDALSDCVEAVRQTAQPNMSRPANTNDMKYKGTLMYKSINKITGIVTMKKRFFAIQKGYLSYYDKESDMENEKEPLNEISLMMMSKIESCDFEKCSAGAGIAIHAKVIKGGDDNGDRIFELDAGSPFQAKTWMEEICKATGKYQLRPKSFGNGYESFVVLTTDKARHASIMIKANASVGQPESQRRTSTNVLFKRNTGALASSEQVDQNESDEKHSSARPLAMMTAGRGGSSALISNAGGRGRGRGTRGSIIPHQLSEVEEVEEINIIPPQLSEVEDIINFDENKEEN